MMKAKSMAIAAIVGIAVVAVLIAVALWFKIEAVAAKADRDKWRSTAQEFAAANEQNVKTMALYRKAAEQNGAIADAQAERLKAIDELSDASRTRVREVIRNDPQASDWANALVPLNVRDATRH